MTIRENLVAKVARIRFEERKLRAQRLAVSEKLTPDEWREAENRAFDRFGEWLDAGRPE